jgi:ketosteroid isomerase-like protein
MRTRILIFVLVCAAILLQGCTLWREHAVNTWADATGGEGLERSFWNDVKNKKWNELERHIAGNYILITPEGRLDRTPALERIKEFQIQDFSMGEIETELHRDTVVVTYSITLRGTHGGQPLSQTPIRRMAVWQQEKAGWMKIADSEIGIQK